MIDCGKISKNLILASCKASSPAIEPEVILINFDDWKAAEKTITEGVLSALTLGEAANGYKYESHKNSLETDCTLSKGTYVNTFDHKVTFRVFSKTQTIKDEINKLANGRVVAITKNANVPEEDGVKYEVFGADNGLEMSESSAPSSGTDGVIYSFSLASGDNAKESALPLTIDAGDVEATDALVESLIKAV